MELNLAGLKEFSAAIDKMIADVDIATHLAVSKGISVIERQAKENATGRPGPNIEFGNLRRSIRSTPVQALGAGSYMAEVGPRMIYGRRIELGMQGPDSLGRQINQQPYPFLGPAVKWATDEALPLIFERSWGRQVMKAGK